MSSNAYVAFLQSQYALTLIQTNQYRFNVTPIANNNFTATNVSETAFSNLTIEMPNTNIMLAIAINVSVSTNGGKNYIPNQLLSNVANEAISMAPSNKSVQAPFQATFGTNNMSINSVTDVLTGVMNAPTLNMPKLYKITFSVISLNVGNVKLLNLIQVSNSSTTMSGCYEWRYLDKNVGLCRNKAFPNNEEKGIGIVITTTCTRCMP